MNDEIFDGELHCIREKINTNPHKENKHGSLISTICCILENFCITNLFEFFKSKGYTVIALIFDGLHVAVDAGHGVTPELLEQAQMYVEQKTGYSITLVRKPLTVLPEDRVKLFGLVGVHDEAKLLTAGLCKIRQNRAFLIKFFI